MDEKDEERRFSLFRRKSTKRDHGSGKNYSGAVAVGARLATTNERSATLPPQSSAPSASKTNMTQSPSGGLFSKLKRKFRLRSSRGKYDLKDYDKPQRFRRKSDDPSRSEDPSETMEASNLVRVTSSVKTPRRSQNDKENVILIRKDKCVSVICQDSNGEAEVIFSNMPSTEDNSDSISESWEEGSEEDPYATINSVKEEIQERFFPNSREKTDLESKQEKDRIRAKQLLQYSVASSANASAATTPNGISNGKPSKIECVNVEDLYAKINSKNKIRKSEVDNSATPSNDELQKQEQKCKELNRFVEAQNRCRQDHEYECLEEVKMRASQLYDKSETSSPNDNETGGDEAVGTLSCEDTSVGSECIEIEPDYETLEDVRQRVSVILCSPVASDDPLSKSDGTSSSYWESHQNDPSSPSSSSMSKMSTSLLEAPTTSGTSASSPSKSPQPPSSPGTMAPLAPTIDTEISPDKKGKDSSSDCIYDNPNVILRKQFFRLSLGNWNLDHSDIVPTTKKSTQAEEELVEKLSAQLAPPLPLRMYEKEEAMGMRRGRARGTGSRHSWSARSSTPKVWNMSGSWHAGMEEPTSPAKEQRVENEVKKSFVIRSKSQEIFDESKEDNIIESSNNNGSSDTQETNDVGVADASTISNEEGQSKPTCVEEAVNEESKDVVVKLDDSLSDNSSKQEINEEMIALEETKIVGKVPETTENVNVEDGRSHNVLTSPDVKISECAVTTIATDKTDSISNVQNDNIVTISCSKDVDATTTDPSNTKTISALDISSSQSAENCSLEEHQDIHESDKQDSFENPQLDYIATDSSHEIDVDEGVTTEHQNQSEEFQMCSSSSTEHSNQSSIDGILTDSVEKDDNQICGHDQRETSTVCLRTKENKCVVGSKEWNMKRKSGPNASASQDIAEMSLAFEHGEFLSGFTEQYKAEEDLEEEEDIEEGCMVADEQTEKGKLLPMSEIVSFPSKENTRLLDINDFGSKKFAPICGCEDFEDCGCDEKYQDDDNDDYNDSQNCVLNTEKNGSAKSNSQTVSISPSVDLKDVSSGDSCGCRDDESRELKCAIVTETSHIKIKDYKKNDDRVASEECVTLDKYRDIARPKRRKKKKATDFDIVSSGCESSPFIQSGSSSSSAINLKMCKTHSEIPWEEFMCQTSYKRVNSSLFSLSSHHSEDIEAASQTITTQHDENQKLFLRSLRLLENIINGFCRQWMAIDLSYLLVGVFKWSRCFHLSAEQFYIIERKLKCLLLCQRDALFSQWNVVANKFYEKQRERHQDDIDSIYQKIRNILIASEGLPTFQNVRLNLLGCFLLQYEVKWPYCLSTLVEQDALRISYEDLRLLMQNLSSDNWMDFPRNGDESFATPNSDPIVVHNQCCCCSDNDNLNQNQAMQTITLDSSCQISLQREFSYPFSTSSMSSSTSASDFSPTELEASCRTFSSPSKIRKSSILNEFLNMCDSVDIDDYSSDEEDENITISTYIKTVTYAPDIENLDITSVHDAVAILSLCRVFHGELAYMTRVRKPSLCKDKELPPCVSKRCHLSNSVWQEMDYLMRKLIPPISPRLDFQFLLRTYAEFKFFVLMERQRRKNSRCFERHCFQIETENGPRCCRQEEMVFMKLIRDELQHFASVIRRSSASESLFAEDRDVSFSLTRLLSITLTVLNRMKNPRRKSSSSRSRSSHHCLVDTSQKTGESSPSIRVSLSQDTFDGSHGNEDAACPSTPLGEECGVANNVVIGPCVELPNESENDDDRDDGYDRDDGDDSQTKCCITPRQKAEFHIENYRSFRAGCMWSDLDLWQSPDVFLDDPNILDRKMGSSFCVDRDTNATMHSHSTWGHYEEPKPLQERDDFFESMQQLQLKEWYWGPLSYEQAASVLNNYDDGSFLVRDSSDRKYLLSLSFKSLGEVYHTRIEHAKGLFSFWSQPDSHGKARICEFIEKSVQNSHDGKFLYFLSPSNHGNPPLPIRLLTPVSRNSSSTPSLRHLSRFVIRQHVRRDLIEYLPVPRMVKSYLRQKQFYVESRDKSRLSVDASTATVL